MSHDFKCLVDTNTRLWHDEEHQRHPFCEYLNLSKINESLEIWQFVSAIGKVGDASMLSEHILKVINCIYGSTVILICRSGISSQLRIYMKTHISPNSLCLHRYFLLFSPFIRTTFFIEAPAEIPSVLCNIRATLLQELRGALAVTQVWSILQLFVHSIHPGWLQ